MIKPRSRRRKSRLVRKEEARSARQALLFGLLTVILALGMVFLGIPALIRMAIFLSDIRSSSQPVESQDSFPPTPPRLKALPEATNQSQIDLEGFSEAGATIEIFIKDQSAKKVVAETDGSFIASGLPLSSGENEIYVQATDEAGNTSQKSGLITIAFDDTPPELEINQPEDGSSTQEKEININGKTEAEATLYINERLVILDSEGNFNYPLALAEGENLVQIVATDEAGNKTEEEIKIISSP